MRKFAWLIVAGMLAFSMNASAADLSPWAKTSFEQASQAGLLTSNVVRNDLKGHITREEFCELIVNLYQSLKDKEEPDPIAEAALESPFMDCDNPAVTEAYMRGIVSGRDEEFFDPQGAVTREELAKMLVNALKAAEVNVVVLKEEQEEQGLAFDDLDEVAEWAAIEVSVAIKYGIISGVEERMIEPLGNATREQAIAIVERAYAQFATDRIAYSLPEWTSVYDGMVVSESAVFQWLGTDEADFYEVIVKNPQEQTSEVIKTSRTYATIPQDVSMPGTTYTILVGATREDGGAVFSAPIDITFSAPQPAQLSLLEKEMRVFPEGVYFETQEEADANMVEVEVPVWVLKDNGTKVASKRYLEVNRNLSEDVIAIFTEIFNDPSQFPIKNVSGYSWRQTAMGKVSQHSYGTCIDINYEENYYCYADGTPITGKYWKPGEDPYSIPEDSIVVKTFAKYGFLWGGNAWGEGSLRDYMHFTYLGK